MAKNIEIPRIIFKSGWIVSADDADFDAAGGGVDVEGSEAVAFLIF